MSRRRLLHCLLAGLAAAVSAPAAWPAGTTGGEADVAADLRMAEEAATMQRVVDRFITRALAGDADGSAALLSRALVERIGAPAATKAMQERILPFFARGGAVGRSATIARTTDAAGQSGFAFYLWLVGAQGEARPFTVYVVEERGRAVVANVVPDRLVEGRHQ